MDSNTRYRLMHKGLDAFNNSQYFEAHEYWEEVWLETESVERGWIQGMIQIAAGFYKLQRNQVINTLSLIRKGLMKLEHCSQSLDGLDVVRFKLDCENALIAIQLGESIQVTIYTTDPFSVQTPRTQ